jgi:hypothetical protein
MILLLYQLSYAADNLVYRYSKICQWLLMLLLVCVNRSISKTRLDNVDTAGCAGIITLEVVDDPVVFDYAAGT